MSVRMRIVVIALVPLIGFLANGFAFTTGEAEVDNAFESVQAAGDAGRRQPRFQGSAQPHAHQPPAISRASRDRAIRQGLQ